MTTPRRNLLFLAFVVWTLLVWLSRIRNIVGNDDLDATGQTVRLVVAAIFISGAVAVAVLSWRNLTARDTVLRIFIVWTVGYWLIRGTGILLDDHGAGFKTIHTVLAVVSIGLALASWPLRRFALSETPG